MASTATAILNFYTYSLISFLSQLPMTNLFPSSLPSFLLLLLLPLTLSLSLTLTIIKVQHDWGKKSPRSQQQSINALLQLVALLNHPDLCKFLPQARYIHCDLCVCVCLCSCVCVRVCFGADRNVLVRVCVCVCVSVQIGMC